MKVSVIINCHNGSEYLRECLDSVINQSLKDFEIIFFDNMSDDDSSSIASEYSDVKLFRSSNFVTLGQARNMALKEATGEYVAFIDCDDIWDSHKLELQANELDNNPEIGLVLTNYIRLNMNSNKSFVVYKKTKRKTLMFDELVSKYHFCLSSFMIRKTALIGLDHLFDERFRYAEEFELFSRIAYGWGTIFLPQPLVTYRIHKKMNTLALQERVPEEYGLILNNLRKMDPNIDKTHARAIRWISFCKDFAETKNLLKSGNNWTAFKKMRKYFFYNKKAFFMCVLSLLPPLLSKKIIKKHYANRY